MQVKSTSCAKYNSKKSSLLLDLFYQGSGLLGSILLSEYGKNCIQKG